MVLGGITGGTSIDVLQHTDLPEVKVSVGWPKQSICKTHDFVFLRDLGDKGTIISKLIIYYLGR